MGSSPCGPIGHTRTKVRWLGDCIGRRCKSWNNIASASTTCFRRGHKSSRPRIRLLSLTT